MRSKYEIHAQKKLEAEGWKVDNKAGMSYWSKNRDYFHLFDLVAVKKGFSVRWIAIKGKAGDYWKLKKEILDFWLPEGNIKELWRYTKGTKIDSKEMIIQNESEVITNGNEEKN